MEDLMNRGEKKCMNCRPTINVIGKINSLVDAMN